MPDYDRQLILAALTGTEDHVIKNGADALKYKADREDKVFTIDNIQFKVRKNGQVDKYDQEDIKECIKDLKGKCRLYICGHGNWQNQLVGGWDGHTWALVLKLWGLETIDLISVVGCNSARGADAAPGALAVDEFRLDHSVGSFGAIFHQELAKTHNLPNIPNEKRIETRVRARILTVSTATEAGVNKAPEEHVGKKVTSERLSVDEKNYGPSIYKRPNSKIEFYWENGQQRKKFVEYEKEASEITKPDDTMVGFPK